MKNILIIAYYYPPKGGSGVQRVAKFSKYLSKLEFNVNVLTVKEDENGLVDESLKVDIKYGLEVYRTDIHETYLLQELINKFNRKNPNSPKVVKADIKPNSFKNKVKKFIRSLAKKIFMTLYNFYYIPDDKRGWIKYAIREGEKIIKEKNIDVIYSTSAPYTTHMIAYKLSKEFNVKWVADFRDQWVTNPFAKYNFILKNIYSFLERRILKSADRILSVSKPIIDDFILRYPDEDKNKFCVITNGYDEDDFANLDLSLSKKNDKFLILYNGTLYGNESPQNFLKAVDNLISKKKVDPCKIRIRFSGNIGYAQQQVIDHYIFKYPDIIECSSFKEHSESLKELTYANALLLLITDVPGSEGIFSGKIFEYIRSGKPILGLIPDGVARDLICETQTGYTAYPSRINEIESIIFKTYSDFINNKVSLHSNVDKIKQYNRENLTKKLISVIESIK